MITTNPLATRFLQSAVLPEGVNPYPDLGVPSPGGLGAPNNNDYYPAATGINDSSSTADEIRQLKCVETLWQYEDLCFRPIQQKILAAWAQYHNIYDSDVDKDEWQSKKATPFFFISLEKLAQAFVQFIEQKPGWFKGEASLPPLEIFTDFVTKWLEWWLKHTCIDFFSKVEDAIKQALITGHVHVAVTVEKGGIPITSLSQASSQQDQNLFVDSLWKELSPFLQSEGTGPSSSEFPFIASPDMPRLCIEIVPTTSVRLDSTGRNRYKMWKTLMGLGEFLQTATERGWDLEACQLSIGGHSRFFDQELNYRAMQGGVVRSQESTMHLVELLHFEGTLHDPSTGEPLWEGKKYMVAANGRKIVYKPTESPFWDGEGLLLSAPFISNSGAVYGKSFLPESIDMMDVKHDLHNILLDYIRSSLQPPRQVDKSLLADTAFLEGDYSLYPNRVIMVRGNGQPVDAIRPVSQPDLPPGFWQYLQFFSQAQQESAGISQELMGATPSRLRQTAMEQSGREAQAGKYLEGVWAGFERRFLRPFLRLCHLRLLQFVPDNMWSCWVRGMKGNILPSPGGKPVSTNPQLITTFQDQINKCADWDCETRYRYFGGFFSWDVSIFNNLYGREGEIEKCTMFLKTIAGVPGGLQAIRLPYFLRKLVEAFGWDPYEALSLDLLPVPDQSALETLDPQAIVSSLVSPGSAPSDDNSPQDPGAFARWVATNGLPPFPPQGAPGMPPSPAPPQGNPGQIGAGLPTMPPGMRGNIP